MKRRVRRCRNRIAWTHWLLRMGAHGSRVALVSNQKGAHMSAKTTTKTKPKAKAKRSAKRLPMPEFAAKHGFNQRRVRRVARDLGMGVGTGNRYGLTAADQKRLLTKLRKNSA